MLYISHNVHQKLLQEHCLTNPENEILEVFANRDGKFLIDTREEHASDPPTQWFIAETNRGIKLKVCFIHKDGDIHIRTAYKANADEIRIYEKYGK